MSDFGKRIKKIRIDNNMTQQGFADFLGLKNKQTVSDVESGKQKSFKDEQITKILEEFGISKVWLMFGEGHKELAANATYGGAGVVAEHAEEYGENELVNIPYLRDIHGAMGEGGAAYSERTTPMAFAPSFLHGMLGLERFDGLHIINSTGNSMDPTIKSGELIFVNPYANEDHRIRDGAIYVILCEDGVLIKRVRQNPIRKELTLISDNPDIENIIMPREEMNDCHIVGRVVGHFEKL